MVSQFLENLIRSIILRNPVIYFLGQENRSQIKICKKIKVHSKQAMKTERVQI
jgi:hypothetical protein